MDISKERKKELIRAYKEKKLIGGIYIITNKDNGKYFLHAETNIEGSQNLFNFSVKAGGCYHFALQKDWQTYGANVFTFKVLAELEKKETQTLKEFQEDLKEFLKIISEDLDPLLEYK